MARTMSTSSKMILFMVAIAIGISFIHTYSYHAKYTKHLKERTESYNDNHPDAVRETVHSHENYNSPSSPTATGAKDGTNGTASTKKAASSYSTQTITSATTPSLRGDSNKTSDATTSPAAATTTTTATATATATTNSSEININIDTNATTIPKFKRYDKVAIVSKIHDQAGWKEMVQSMCLLHYAYNHRVLYDIVIFTTLDFVNMPDWEPKIKEVEAIVAPAKITFVTDNRGLQEEIAALKPSKRDLLLKRCNTTDPTTITWDTKCHDDPDKAGNPKYPVHTLMSYHWQAEFRSIHIWSHKALAGYRYMLWLDSDGFATREWKVDPVEYFIENEGVVMFDNLQGRVNLPGRIHDAFFNRSLCRLKLNKDTGNFDATYDGCSKNPDGSDTFIVPTIHGFFHITDLDFYRSEKVLGSLKRLIGDCFLCRRPDDQLAVTLPAAYFAPEKAWDMQTKGFVMNVFHNFMMDGKTQMKPAGFRKHWKFNSSMHFPTANANCKITNAGR